MMKASFFRSSRLHMLFANGETSIWGRGIICELCIEVCGPAAPLLFVRVVSYSLNLTVLIGGDLWELFMVTFKPPFCYNDIEVEFEVIEFSV